MLTDLGGGWSSIGGTIMRTNIYDNKGVAVNFDFPLWKTGDFNKVTNRWIHFALTVKGRSIILYNDGVAVPDSSFGFYRIGHTLECYIRGIRSVNKIQ